MGVGWRQRTNHWRNVHALFDEASRFAGSFPRSRLVDCRPPLALPDPTALSGLDRSANPSAVRAVVAPDLDCFLVSLLRCSRLRSLARSLRSGTERNAEGSLRAVALFLFRRCVFGSCDLLVASGNQAQHLGVSSHSIQSLPPAAVAPARLSRLSPATLSIILDLPYLHLHTYLPYLGTYLPA